MAQDDSTRREEESVRFENDMRKMEERLLELGGVRLGHREFLHRAFQHRSYLHENGRAVSYETLEFLGDRVLELCVAEWLYRRDPNAGEGALSKELAWRVDEANLVKAGDRLGVRAAIRLGSSLDREGVSDRMVADVVEAIIAGIYLDRSLKAAMSFIDRMGILEGEPPKGFHSTNELMERCKERGLGEPEFIDSMSGPDNQAEWTVECLVNGRRTVGVAKRLKDARKMACQKMLSELQVGLKPLVK